METHTVVRPEHLNQSGCLFGGQMLRWVDEFAWLAATKEYPACHFVTRAMDRVEFTRQVPNGAILRFACSLEHLGHTSVTYLMEVYAQPPEQCQSDLVFHTRITFVNLDAYGQGAPILPSKPGQHQNNRRKSSSTRAAPPARRKS